MPTSCLPGPAKPPPTDPPKCSWPGFKKTEILPLIQTHLDGAQGQPL